MTKPGATTSEIGSAAVPHHSERAQTDQISPGNAHTNPPPLPIVRPSTTLSETKYRKDMYIYILTSIQDMYRRVAFESNLSHLDIPVLQYALKWLKQRP